MKKIFLSILTLIIALSMTLCLTGCWFDDSVDISSEDFTSSDYFTDDDYKTEIGDDEEETVITFDDEIDDDDDESIDDNIDDNVGSGSSSDGDSGSESSSDGDSGSSSGGSSSDSGSSSSDSSSDSDDDSQTTSITKTTTITEPGSYTISGTLSNGQIIVDVTNEEKVQLYFDGVTITNSYTAPIYVKEADKVTITLNSGTVNTLTTTIDESLNTEDDNVDACIFSKGDVTINGDGTLNIYSYNGNGISAKDDLKITGGTFNIECDRDGLEVNDDLAIAGGTFNITTNGGWEEAPTQEGDDSDMGGMTFPGFSSGRVTSGSSSSSSSSSDTTPSCKALKSDTMIYIEDGTFNLDCYDDAVHSDDTLQINSGNFTIYTGDDALHANISNVINGGNIHIGYCYEGIEGQKVTINGGDIYIWTYNDGVNASLSDTSTTSTVYISVTGGNINIDIEEDCEGDGFDSNSDISVSGGYISISGTTNTKDTPLDYDGSGQITGGTFISGGSSGVTTQNFGSSSTQCAIYYELNRSQSGTFSLKDSSGNTVISFTPTNSYEVVNISTADITLGETYTLTAGSESHTIKMSSTIYGTGNHSSSSMFGW